MSKFSGEAEYQTFSLISSEVIWLKRLLLHFEFTIPSIMLFCDSKSAIDLTSNPAHHERSKHIDIDYHFIRELVQSNILKLVHVKSQRQVADVFTKPLLLLACSSFIRKLELINIYSPT